MKAIKFAVIFMSLLLISGFAVLVITLLSRMSDTTENMALDPANKRAVHLADAAIPTSLNLKPSERIISTDIADKYVIFSIENQNDAQQNRYIIYTFAQQTQSILYLYPQ